MTREEIAARNRLNAQKSTGPKTANGKAVVAGNARRHGATARPDPETVVTWIGIILDDPDITVEALLPNNERGIRALLLAQAEVQLATAMRALREFEAGMPLTLRIGRPLSGKDIVEGLASGEIPKPDMTLKHRQVYQEILARKEEYQSAKRGKKLLKRYLGEARARRRKALAAWLIASGGERVAG